MTNNEFRQLLERESLVQDFGKESSWLLDCRGDWISLERTGDTQLIVHLYLINVFLLCPLSRKGPNARHTGAPVAHSSCSWIAFRQYHSFVPRLPLQAFLSSAGCCGTWFARLYKKIYTRANHQTVLTQWPAADRSFRCVAYGAGFYLTLLLYATKNCALRLHWCAFELLVKRASMFLGKSEDIVRCAVIFS